MNRHGRTAEELLDAGEGTVKAGAFPVELVDQEPGAQVELSRVFENLLGSDFDAGDSVHHDQGRVGSGERSARVLEEDVEPGSIDEVDLRLVPLGDRNGRGDRDLARHLFVVEVGNRVALIGTRQAVHGAGGEQQGGSELRLAGITVTAQRDVADVSCFVDLHSGEASLRMLQG